MDYPLWPLDEGVLGLTITIRVDDATLADQKVTSDQITGAITDALKPLFSQLPCVDIDMSKE